MALALSRRIGEVLCIGDDITVTVTAIVGTQVKLAIEAPRHIAIDRQEIRKRKQQDKPQRGGRNYEL